MNREDLLKMLDLISKDSSDTADNITTRPLTNKGMDPASGKDWTARIEYSSTALVLDQWDKARGQGLIHQGYPNTDYLEAADFFNLAFTQEPTLVEHCLDGRRFEYIQTMMETSDYKSLRSSTILNTAASTLAAIQFGQGYEKLKAKDQQRRSKPGKDKKESMKEEMDLNNAVCMALDNANEEVDGLCEAMKSFGHDPGTVSQMDLKDTLALFQRVKNSATLKRICELAGRYRMLAQSKQRQKTQHGYEDMVGVHLDDTIGLLLDEELVSLLDPDMEMDTLRRLSEKETLALEYRGMETEGKGPIIVAVDESGSMTGEKIANSKALALALGWIAKKQRRWCCFVSFASRGEGHYLLLKPGKWEEGKLMDWLQHFYNGGTSLTTCCYTLPFVWWEAINPPKGRTDLIVVTDGEVDLDSDMRDKFLAWKKQTKLKVHSLVLDDNAGGLAEISDHVYLLQSLSVGQEGVGAVLSI